MFEMRLLQGAHGINDRMAMLEKATAAVPMKELWTSACSRAEPGSLR